MVRPQSRFVTATLSGGNLLIADACSIPQDLYLVTSGEFTKVFTDQVTSELNSGKLLKRKVSLSPDVDFQIEKFSVSSAWNICAVGRHCLAILQPLGDLQGCREIDSIIFRSYPVCRYLFNQKSQLELVQAIFVSAEKEMLSVLSTDCTLRLFDLTHLSSETLLAPFRTVNLIYPQRNIGSISSRRPVCSTSLSSSSRISLAKCEPFVSVAYLSDAAVAAAIETPSKGDKVECNNIEVQSFLPFMALRSNGDVYFGFVDISKPPTICSPSSNSEKGIYDCQLAGPLKMQISQCDIADEASYFDLNACAMQVICGANFAKGTPLVIIASANGSLGHYLLMAEPSAERNTPSYFAPAEAAVNSTSSLQLHFPPCCLYAVDRVRVAIPSHSTTGSFSATSWLYDPSVLRIFVEPGDKAFSYIATAASSVFRISLPWLETAPNVSDSAFVARISDEPTFVESLLSLGDQNVDSITVGQMRANNAFVVAMGSTLYAVPTSIKAATQQAEQYIAIEDNVPLFVSNPLGLSESTGEDVLPPSEDFVAVMQRALARQANLNPKLLSNNLPSSKDGADDQLNTLYSAATGAVALLAQEYFGRTDVAARQLTRLQATCDARLRLVTGTLEKRLSKSCTEFGTITIPNLSNRIDNVADRLASLVQRLSKLSDISRNKYSKKSSVLEEVCVKEGFTDQLTDVDVNLAQINTLYGEVEEKASYLATQLTAFTERGLGVPDETVVGAEPPTSLVPLFESLGGDIRHIADDLRGIKDEVDRIDSRF